MTSSNSHTPNIKTLIITIQENETNIYEYQQHQLLFGLKIDNDRITSREEANENWNTFATGRGKILGGNEGNWKDETDKHILKLTFKTLNDLYNQAEYNSFEEIVIFYGSNTAKEGLESEVEKFNNNHPKITVELVNKNIHGHEMIIEQLQKLFKARN